MKAVQPAYSRNSKGTKLVKQLSFTSKICSWKQVRIIKLYINFNLIDMKEVLNVIICHTTLEQYTGFNFPFNDISELTP